MNLPFRIPNNLSNYSVLEEHERNSLLLGSGLCTVTSLHGVQHGNKEKSDFIVEKPGKHYLS